MRRSNLLTLLLVLTLPAWVGAQTASDEAPARSGFWISLGVGGGPISLDCDGLCAHDFGRGTGGDLSLGGTIDEHWLLGADLLGWFPWSEADEGYSDDTDGFGAILFTARYYPQAQRGLFVNGGIGFGEIDVQDDDLEATGYVGKVGVGYDLRIGRNFSFTPFLSLVRTFNTEARIAGETVDGNVGFGMATLGVAVTWH